MLKAIVNFLNLKLELLNYFDLTRCLCELKTKGDVIAPKEYISGGEFQDIDFDSANGVSYWRLRDTIDVSRESNPNKALKRVQTTVPLRLVFSVPRTNLTQDDAYSFDRIRQTIVKQFNVDNGALCTALGAAKVTITAPSSNGDPLSVWSEETSGTQTQEPDFKYVFGSVDINIVIDSDTDCLPTECDDVDSDILHTFDFCSVAVQDRLTVQQVDCLTAWLANCADVTEQVNGVDVGTAASGSTNNQEIEDTLGNPVGTAANPSVIGDATVENSDASVSVTVEAEGTNTFPDTPISANSDLVINQPSGSAVDLVVRYQTQGTVSTTVVGGEVVVPDAVNLPSLSIEVYSDAGYTIPVTSLSYGATAYIKLVSTDITPTSYSFFFGNGSKNAPQVTQAGNTLAWVVSLTGTVTISATATDGTDATADATPFSLTSTLVITKSLKFDGVNDFAIGTPMVQSSANFSVTFWFKLNSLVGKQGLFSFYDLFNNARDSLTLYYESNAIYYLSNLNNWNFNRNIGWTGNTDWHHFTFTYNSSTTVQFIYVDGVNLGGLYNNALIGNFDKFVLGNALTRGQYGNINMTDIAMHNVELSGAQVTALQTLGSSSGNEVQRFPITENVGTLSGQITDIVNNQKATLRNMTTGFGIVADAP